MYNVQELIDKLKECDPDDDVLISYCNEDAYGPNYLLKEIDVIVFSKKKLAVVLSAYNNLSPELKDEPRL